MQSNIQPQLGTTNHEKAIYTNNEYVRSNIPRLYPSDTLNHWWAKTGSYYFLQKACFLVREMGSIL